MANLLSQLSCNLRSAVVVQVAAEVSFRPSQTSSLLKTWLSLGLVVKTFRRSYRASPAGPTPPAQTPSEPLPTPGGSMPS